MKLRVFENELGEGIIDFEESNTASEVSSGVDQMMSTGAIITHRGNPGDFYHHLTVDGERIYEYGSPCGTCGIVFRKVGASDNRLRDAEAVELLGRLDDLPSDTVLRRLAKVLPVGQYHPLIFEKDAVRVEPGSDNDYFSTDVLRLFGPNSPGLEDPAGARTSYYRFGRDCELEWSWLTRQNRGWRKPRKALVTALVMPLHDLNQLNRERVEHWKRQYEDGIPLTAFAVAVADHQGPAMGSFDRTYPYSELVLLTNCLIDGHHRIQAASEMGVPARLLSLVSKEFSVYSRSDDFVAALRLLRHGSP